MAAKKVLIAGGSGFTGKLLSEYFISSGFDVAILSRESRGEKNFFWDPKKEEIDEKALSGVSCVINLSGASIAGRRWTRKRKQEIINSRIQSTDFLYEKLRTINHQVDTFISASGTGYYGNHKSEWLDETSSPSGGFLSNCCRYWEEAATKVSALGIRTVIFRIGVVLSGEGGALPKLALPVKLYVGSPLGSGKQFISWIHYADFCTLFLKAVEDKNMNGIYNAVAPEPVTNRTFMKSLAQALNRPMFLPPVPSFLLRLVLGEMATALTSSERVSSKKITDVGFHFQFPQLDSALKNIYSEKL
jgi:uncharacterized protein (TIGR01777 family)